MKRILTQLLLLAGLLAAGIARAGETADTITSGSFRLPATLSLPEGATAGVVLVHGSGPSDRDETVMACHPFRDIAEALAAQGIAVLRYDKRTYVYRDKSVEPGKELTIDDEVTDDAIAAVRHLKAVLKDKPVYVVGHSLGAMMAPRIAQRCPEVSGLILLGAPARDLLTLAGEQVKYLMGGAASDAAVNQVIEQMKASAPESYWKSLEDYDPVKTAQQLSLPILQIQGGRDYQVPMGDYYMWSMGMMGKKNFKQLLYPTLNHLMIAGEGPSTPQEYGVAGTVSREVTEAMGEFVKMKN